MRILITILTLFAFGYSSAQDDTQVTTDTIISNFRGELRLGYTLVDSVKIRNGTYKFNAPLMPDLDGYKILLKEAKIEGRFVTDLEHGVWKYSFNTYETSELSMSQAWKPTLQFKLNGTEDVYSIGFSAGKFHGKASKSRRNVVNDRYGRHQSIASTEYNNDTLVGAFAFEEDGRYVKGSINEQGYFDGTVEFGYQLNGANVVESRTYTDGFLLNLKISDKEQNETIDFVTYNDVINKLDSLKLVPSDLNFRISDRWFGVQFNLGYQSFDPKLQLQQQGNALLTSHLSAFDSLHTSFMGLDTTRTILKLTRRFEFVYPAGDDSLAQHLTSILAAQRSELKALLDRPSLQMRAANNDTTYINYQVLKHIDKKQLLVKEVLKKVTTGYFDFRFRDKYYEEGVPGLNRPDTLVIEVNDSEHKVPFVTTHRVDKPSPFLRQLENYLMELNEIQDRYVSSVLASMQIFEKQDIIDSLDRVIAAQDTILFQLYSKREAYAKSTPDDMTFSYKMYFSAQEQILDDLQRKYLSNGMDQKEMIQTGSEISCVNAFLIDNKKLLNRMDGILKHWSDSLFTVYRDNPFDYRPLESKILEGVESASRILLRSYANELLNSNSCEEQQSVMQKIKALEKRVKFLVQNSQSQNVVQLNRTLRRERVPARIERILEI